MATNGDIATGTCNSTLRKGRKGGTKLELSSVWEDKGKQFSDNFEMENSACNVEYGKLH